MQLVFLEVYFNITQYNKNVNLLPMEIIFVQVCLEQEVIGLSNKEKYGNRSKSKALLKIPSQYN